MKVVNLLIFFSIFIFCISSGCINENLKEEAPHPLITNVDVMSIPADEEFGLKVTVYMQNPMDRDTGSLSIKVKTKDQYTNLITGEHMESVGYLKAKSQSYKTLFFNVPTSGEQLVIVELFEDNNLVDQQSTYVQLIEEAVKPVPNVILTDLLIETIQATNYGQDIIFEASPGFYNQGDEANKVTVVVTAVADEYTRYTGSAIASNLEQNQRTRATVRMTVPADRSYSFEVNVIVDSEITASGETSTSIKLHDIKLKTPTTYALIESGSPVSYDEAIDEIPVEDSAEYAAPSPGFEAIMFAISMLFAIGILRKKKREI
ncbi:DUF7490 domain-containing protein [Methanolobus psychrotolerans]|uniref:DUF7490 domain-containing protein n=1 Tax=Methanolobus psychrotolerans TaxID=1874706 RepID=UPI000B917D58|nr:hypothetical protein [Methanolobus psychrotolerans]